MPAPSRTSLDEIVSVGRRLLEQEGREGLTMKRVADLVGVRAPSLYKHVANRAELIRLIAEATVDELGEVLETSTSGIDPDGDLRALATALRSFAHANPESYRLVFSPVPEEWKPDRDVLIAAVAPVLRTTAALTGNEDVLDAARLVTAWAHGFLTMELAGAFRMDGDIDRAFEYGVARLATALRSR